MRNARRAAKAANLVRSANPRDIDALTPPSRTESRRLGKIAPGRVRANSRRKTALNPLQPCRKEAVEAAHARVRVAPVALQGAQVTVGVKKLGGAGAFVLSDRSAADARLARKQRLDLLFALLGFERADAIDDLAARFGQRDGALEQAVLQTDELREIGLALEPADVGVPPDRTGGRAGRI